jgi:hypothetical protein
MSRSMRHSPLVPATNTESEKTEKRLAHQRERKWVHDHLKPTLASDEDFDMVTYHEHPHSGSDTFAKQGKAFVKSAEARGDHRLMMK